MSQVLVATHLAVRCVELALKLSVPQNLPDRVKESLGAKRTQLPTRHVLLTASRRLTQPHAVGTAPLATAGRHTLALTAQSKADALAPHEARPQRRAAASRDQLAAEGMARQARVGGSERAARSPSRHSGGARWVARTSDGLGRTLGVLARRVCVPEAAEHTSLQSLACVSRRGRRAALCDELVRPV